MPERKTKGQETEAKAQGEHEIVSPRDHASGLPTGKRMHKPMAMAAGPGQGPTASQQAYDGAPQGTGGEMNNLQLQTQMDKRPKAESAISNVMHASSETTEDVVDNMK